MTGIPVLAGLLKAEQVDSIHQASLEVLQRVGVRVASARAREYYRRHGCLVDEEAQVVHLPGRIVEDCLQAVPGSFTFCGRDPAFDRTIPEDGPIVSTASSAVHLIDPVTGALRQACAGDVGSIAWLVDQLDGFDLFTLSVIAGDAPAGYRNLHRLYQGLRNCRKPIRVGGIETPEEAEAVYRLGVLVAGSEQAFLDHPFFAIHTCPMVSPLVLHQAATDVLMLTVERGIPHHISIVPNAGLTSPMSLVGTLIQGNAEFLAVTALMQMIRPGTPVIYNTLPTVGDMRTGSYIPGAIECGILHMGFAQLAAYYRVPSGGYMGMTNSKTVDAQEGYEKALSSLAALLAGASLIQIGGLLDALLTFDYAALVVDWEIGQMLKRLVRGLEYSSDEVEASLKVIAEVGPGGTYLEAHHTLERMRVVSFTPLVADRSSYRRWQQEGGRDARTRALEIARDILNRRRESYLAPDLIAKILKEFPGLGDA